MAANSLRTIPRRFFSWLRRSWRSVLVGIGKAFVLFVISLDIYMGFENGDVGPAARLNALFLLMLLVISLAYLWYVSSQVRFSMPGIEEGLEEYDADKVTIQVSRLNSDAARITIANHAWLPVLRAVMAVKLVNDPRNEDAEAAVVKGMEGKPFSLRARSTESTVLANVFDHVGVFMLFSTGIRVYSLLGLTSRIRGKSKRWRIRVVPNIYRLSYGIPKQRQTNQDSLGLPRSQADALDYDRVRDYRPGDPLKTIHWKLVAHSQGELYTKLYETPTISSATLVIDPYGPDSGADFTSIAYHLYDTMLEGGFSLLEHARENGIEGCLYYVDREGSLVEADWAGPAMLGWFVETARRPSPAQHARELSIKTIQSLRSGHQGYVIFATSKLTKQSVRELISCHRAGVALLVVHALPPASGQEAAQQRAYDARLRDASIGVIGLTDGSQIVQEVMPS